MRFVFRLVPVLLVALLVTTAFGQLDPADSDIFNTPHNMANSGLGIVIPDGQICLPCHVPHFAYPYDEDAINSVLWNHDAPNHTFTMYTTLNNVTPGQPEGPSKMCLGCHDGVTAIDNYGGTTDGTIVMPAGSEYNIGEGGPPGDLSNDHPIGIVYPTGNPGYNAPPFLGVQLVNIGGDDRVECTSCHEPHNNSLGRFLRRELAESRICLECHHK